jgi:hypothetical protein
MGDLAHSGHVGAETMPAARAGEFAGKDALDVVWV